MQDEHENKAAPSNRRERRLASGISRPRPPAPNLPAGKGKSRKTGRGGVKNELRPAARSRDGGRASQKGGKDNSFSPLGLLATSESSPARRKRPEKGEERDLLDNHEIGEEIF